MKAKIRIKGQEVELEGNIVEIREMIGLQSNTLKAPEKVERVSVKLNKHYARWNTDDLTTLKHMIRQNAKISAIAKQLGRTSKAISLKGYRTFGGYGPVTWTGKHKTNNLSLPKRSRRYEHWGKKEDKTVQSLRTEGKSYGEIAETLGRTRSAVQVRSSQLEREEASIAR